MKDLNLVFSEMWYSHYKANYTAYMVKDLGGGGFTQEQIMFTLKEP